MHLFLAVIWCALIARKVCNGYILPEMSGQDNWPSPVVQLSLEQCTAKIFTVNRVTFVRNERLLFIYSTVVIS
jgi:hypothetical protein